MDECVGDSSAWTARRDWGERPFRTIGNTLPTPYVHVVIMYPNIHVSSKPSDSASCELSQNEKKKKHLYCSLCASAHRDPVRGLS